MRDEQQLYRSLKVTTLGVNPASVASHEKYKALLRFNFELASDPAREVAAAYRALKADGKGILRTVYLIATDGHVVFGQRGMPAAPAILKPLE